MYENIFSSPNRPFCSTPEARFYVACETSENARSQAVRAVERAEGPVAIMGGAGLGKSLVAEMIASDLQGDFEIVRLHSARLTSRKDMLQTILFELEQEYKGLSEGELRLAILDYLEPKDGRTNKGLCILVDEAHTLPTRLLDELRLMTNFTREHEPRARIVLLGSLRLDETFLTPEMESFNQRLAVRCYLSPLRNDETANYIRRQIEIAGFEPEKIIDDSGVATVFSACEGVPRLVNQLMDQSLVLAVTHNRFPINEALVQEAWSSLQQLPPPWEPGGEPTQAGAFANAAISTAKSATPAVGAELQATTNANETGVVATPRPNYSVTVEFAELQDDSDQAGQTLADNSAQPLASEPVQVDEVQHEATASEPSVPAAFGDELDTFVVECSSMNESEDSASALGASSVQTIGSDRNGMVESSESEGFVYEIDGYSIQMAEELEVRDAVEQNNFFAAFTEVGKGELPESVLQNLSRSEPDAEAEASAPQDAEVEAQIPEDFIESVEDLSNEDEIVLQVKSFADVGLADVDGVEDTAEVDPGSVLYTADSFFEGLPTDEKLIALVEEQTQIQAMGLWDAAPPVPEIRLAETDEVASRDPDPIAGEPALDLDVNRQSESNSEQPSTEGVAAGSSSTNLFGDDFDEEFSLASLPSQLGANSNRTYREIEIELDGPASELIAQADSNGEVAPESPEGSPADAGQLEGAPEADDWDLGMDFEVPETDSLLTASSELHGNDLPPFQSVDASTTVGDDYLPEDSARISGDEPSQFLAAEQVSESWSIEVAPADYASEESVHSHVEELLEQLNFQGISEVVTTEQIEGRLAQNSQQPPSDSIRTGPEDEVYAMHKAEPFHPQSDMANSQNDYSESYDDDRDLLIVEEEVTLRSAESQAKTETKPTPYKQLFAKLRK